MRTSVRITAQGSAYTRLQRALAARNATLALAAAAELPHVRLGDALAICLLLLDKEPERFDRAAMRWHRRLCADARLPLTDANLALTGLIAMGRRPDGAGGHAVLAVCDAHGLDDAAAVLERWMDARPRA
jgi:hypothetical protein